MGLELDLDRNIVILKKLDFGELSGIMGGLWGSLQSKGWSGQRQDKERNGSKTLDWKRCH